MPKDLSGDARHLAVASFHRCDYPLTWNCRHIANANKIGRIRRIMGRLNLETLAGLEDWSPSDKLVELINELRVEGKL